MGNIALRPLLGIVALALGGILFVAWRTLELPRADRNLAAPAVPPSTESRPERELVPVDVARVRASESEAPLASAPADVLPAGDLGELVLVRGATLRGFVHDRAGAPIEDAHIEALASEEDSALRTTRRSSTDGSFEIFDAPSGRVQVSAQLDDGRRSVDSVTVEVEPDGSLGGIDLIVPIYADSNAILGLVLDVDGSPLAGAPVNHVRYRANGDLSFGAPRFTDTRGRFRLQGQPGASFRITAEHPRGAAVAAHIEGVEPGRHDVVLRLTAARNALLRVRDPSGAAIERFAYRMRVKEGPVSRYGATGGLAHHAGGEIELAIPGEAFVVELSAPGHASIEFGPHDSAAMPFVLDATLYPFPALRGRVVHRGEPVAGAVVRALAAIAAARYVEHESFAQVAESCRGCPEATTDADGAFVLDVGRAGDWWLCADSSGEVSSLAGPFAVSTNDAMREIVLDVGPRGAITGHVRHAHGRPIEEREVRASRGDGVLISATTEARGAYRFDALAPGAWQVRLRELEAKDSSSMDVRYVRVSAVPPIVWDCRVSDGATARFDIVVPEPAHLVVSIAATAARLIDASWKVSASRERVAGEPQLVEARVGELPSEHVLELPTGGEWTVSARTVVGELNLGLVHTLTVPAGTSALVWSVPDGAVRGRLKPEFPPEARVRLAGRLADGPALGATIGVHADGAFEFPFAITGRYELVLDSNSERRTSVTATAGQTVDVGEF